MQERKRTNGKGKRGTAGDAPTSIHAENIPEHHVHDHHEHKRRKHEVQRDAIHRHGFGTLARRRGNPARAYGRELRRPIFREALFTFDLQKRLNRAIGQLNGVKAMIDDNRYCGDVLTQLAAAESAVHSISAILLQNHLETCVVEQIEAGNIAIIDEAMQLIKKFAR